MLCTYRTAVQRIRTLDSWDVTTQCIPQVVVTGRDVLFEDLTISGPKGDDEDDEDDDSDDDEDDSSDSEEEESEEEEEDSEEVSGGSVNPSHLRFMAFVVGLWPWGLGRFMFALHGGVFTVHPGPGAC